MSDESRQHARIAVEIEVAVTDIDRELSGIIMNISEGGLFIRTDSPLDVFSRIRIRFKLPKTDFLVGTEAVVIWNLQPEQADVDRDIFPGMGVQFQDISDEDVNKIREVVGQNVPKP